MSIVVTGATGHLGRLVIDGLLAPASRRSASPPSSATRRRPPTSPPAASSCGSPTTSAPETLTGRLPPPATGCLLISGSEVGQRVAQHTAVIDAAKARGRRAAGVHGRPRRARRRLRRWPPSTRRPSSDPRLRAAVHLPAQRLVHRELHREPRPGPGARRRHRQRGRGPGRLRRPRRLRRRGRRRPDRRGPREPGVRAERRRRLDASPSTPPRSPRQTGRTIAYNDRPARAAPGDPGRRRTARGLRRDPRRRRRRDRARPARRHQRRPVPADRPPDHPARRRSPRHSRPTPA